MDIGADAILTVSQAGITAQMVSRFRPDTLIVALLLDEQVQRQMALYWGVEPITMPRASSSDELVDLAVRSAEQAGLVRRGDLVVVTAGVPVGISGTTNMIRVQQVGGSLVNAVGIGTQQTSGPLCVCRTTDEVPQKFRSGTDLQLATLSVGFADGIPVDYARGQGPILVHGRRTRFLELCMDQSIIDVTGIPCKVGDEVTLIGQDGDERISIYSIEKRTGRTFDALLTFISDRIARICR